MFQNPVIIAVSSFQSSESISITVRHGFIVVRMFFLLFYFFFLLLNSFDTLATCEICLLLLNVTDNILYSNHLKRSKFFQRNFVFVREKVKIVSHLMIQCQIA